MSPFLFGCQFMLVNLLIYSYLNNFLCGYRRVSLFLVE